MAEPTTLSGKTTGSGETTLSGKTHKTENFPVASRLVRPEHRPPIMAFYDFARAADDVADDSAFSAEEKIRRLDAMEAGLTGEGDHPLGVALRAALKARGLSGRHARDLLIAFRADATKLRYADWWELMGYCAYSANPVGRFVLDVHGEDEKTWGASDAICSALQIVNHLQDCADDYKTINRVYVPLDRLAAHGVAVEALGEPRASRELRAVIVELAQRTRTLLREGRTLAGDVRDAPAEARNPGHLRARGGAYRPAAGHGPARGAREAAALAHGSRGVPGGGGEFPLWRAQERARSGGAVVTLAVSEPVEAAQTRAAKSSFYWAMRLMPKAQRQAMFEIYSFCRAVDDIADDGGPKDVARARLERWRADLAALYAGSPPARLKDLAEAVATFGMRHEDFLAVIDGMEMDVERTVGAGATDWATLDLYCDRVASAVGRLSVRVFGMGEADGIALSHHLGRALQLTNILRDLDEDAEIDRLYLPLEALHHAGITASGGARGGRRQSRRGGVPRRRLGGAVAFRGGAGHLRPHAAPRPAHAAHHGRGLSLHSRPALCARLGEPPRETQTRQGQAHPHRRALLSRMSAGKVHVIGAGLAGLSAAVELAAAGRPVAVYEASPQAGGRCRSYFDPTLGMEIDNGNHLVLSGNHATLAYAARIGAADKLVGPGAARFPFMDLASGERWTLDANDGLVPYWMLSGSRRVPGTSLGEYLELTKLLMAGRKARIADTLACKGPLWERLIEPFLVAALNIEATEGSSALAGQVVRETLAAGGRNYHPLIAREGLSNALVRPALAYLEARGAPVAFGQRLKAVVFDGDKAGALDFGDARVEIAAGEAVIFATPPQVTAPLLPGVSTPTEFRSIVNAHYRVEPPPGLPQITGIVGGVAQWLFAFPERLSVTISAGDAWLDTPREELAARIWKDVAAVAGLSGEAPRWQIVRERRATFAASPAQDALRPGTRTKWRNVVLAGDWTQTKLPATIEGSIRSGVRGAGGAEAVGPSSRLGLKRRASSRLTSASR